MARKAVDRTGHRYGRLTVIERAPNIPTIKGARWRCVCDCGNHTIVSASNLRFGSSTSCGCLRSELHSEACREKATKHGRSVERGPTYRSWEAMRQRCNNPNSDWYHLYGGSGVSVCERWSSFENFLKDMGERPENRTLDRVNPYGNYEPNNCRWASPAEQSNNKRKKCNEKVGDDA